MRIFKSVLSCNPSCYSLGSVPYDSSLLKTSPGLCARCYKLLVLLIDLRISGCNISHSFYCVTTHREGYDGRMVFFPSNFTVFYPALLFFNECDSHFAKIKLAPQGGAQVCHLVCLLTEHPISHEQSDDSHWSERDEMHSIVYNKK